MTEDSVQETPRDVARDTRRRSYELCRGKSRRGKLNNEQIFAENFLYRKQP
jgi:hypothetical protein